MTDRIVPVDVARFCLDVRRDLSVTPREHRPGPPERIGGMTLGIVTMERDAPHGGEMHPDGDEFLYVISGKVRVTGDSAPDEPLVLEAGDACIVREGEWHQVNVIEPAQLMYLSPGPNGDHRPL